MGSNAFTTSQEDPFELRLVEIRRRSSLAGAKSRLWLSHHWPEDYADRCVKVGSRHVCRRCAALYPLGFAVAFLAAFGFPLWPAGWDPAAIWALSIPGTVAFVGVALGVFAYSPRWQVAATLITALAFGRGLGYELANRWSPEFWQPVALFGGVWFFATLFEHTTKPPGGHNTSPVMTLPGTGDEPT